MMVSDFAMVTAVFSGTTNFHRMDYVLVSVISFDLVRLLIYVGQEIF